MRYFVFTKRGSNGKINQDLIFEQMFNILNQIIEDLLKPKKGEK